MQWIDRFGKLLAAITFREPIFWDSAKSLDFS